MLRLEVLDWRLDHGVDANTLTFAAEAADGIAATIMIPAPPEEASS